MKEKHHVHHAQLVISNLKVDQRVVNNVLWDTYHPVQATVLVNHALLVTCGQAPHHVQCALKVNGNLMLVKLSVSHVPMVQPPIMISPFQPHKLHVHHVMLVLLVLVVTVTHVPLVDMVSVVV